MKTIEIKSFNRSDLLGFQTMASESLYGSLLYRSDNIWCLRIYSITTWESDIIRAEVNRLGLEMYFV